MAFRKKYSKVLDLQPNILIIPECENETRLQFGKLTPIPNDFLWFGDNPNKGIGIFSYSDYKLDLIDYTDRFRYVIPIQVKGDDSFTLFAVWAMDCKENWNERYIGQVWLGIKHYDYLLTDSTVLTGDFNSNKIWDSFARIANHTNVVDYLDSKSIRSLYHDKFKMIQGNEKHPTLFMYKKQDMPYHIDYCFASNDLIKRGYDIAIGNYDDWISESDHVPLVIDFNL